MKNANQFLGCHLNGFRLPFQSDSKIRRRLSSSFESPPSSLQRKIIEKVKSGLHPYVFWLFRTCNFFSISRAASSPPASCCCFLLPYRSLPRARHFLFKSPCHLVPLVMVRRRRRTSSLILVRRHQVPFPNAHKDLRRRSSGPMFIPRTKGK